MNMFARFDENQAMTLLDIKETKRFGRTHGRPHGQRENSIPSTNKVCGGYNEHFHLRGHSYPHERINFSYTTRTEQRQRHPKIVFVYWRLRDSFKVSVNPAK